MPVLPKSHFQHSISPFTHFLGKLVSSKSFNNHLIGYHLIISGACISLMFTESYNQHECLRSASHFPPAQNWINELSPKAGASSYILIHLTDAQIIPSYLRACPYLQSNQWVILLILFPYRLSTPHSWLIFASITVLGSWVIIFLSVLFQMAL